MSPNCTQKNEKSVKLLQKYVKGKPLLEIEIRVTKTHMTISNKGILHILSSMLGVGNNVIILQLASGETAFNKVRVRS